MKMDIQLNGSGYTQSQALAMKESIIAYANTNGLKGTVIIAEQL